MKDYFYCRSIPAYVGMTKETSVECFCMDDFGDLVSGNIQFSYMTTIVGF